MSTVRFHEGGKLRAATVEHARVLFEERWGVPINRAHEQTLDVALWMKEWVVARDVEKRAARHLSAFHDAAFFVEACRVDKMPMGQGAHLLADCGPELLRLLDAIDRKRANRFMVNPAVPAERATWIHRCLQPVFYETRSSLEAAPRQELAVLALIGGWWEPPQKADLVAGVKVQRALAAEADRMARARKSALKIVAV